METSKETSYEEDVSYPEISINENDEEDAIEKIDDVADTDGSQEVIVSSNLPKKVDRREKVSKLLKDQREKRCHPKSLMKVSS